MTASLNFSLKQDNTFAIDATAARFVTLETAADFRSMATQLPSDGGLFFVLGGGSNVVFRDRYEGTVIHPVNKGVSLIEKNDSSCIVEAAAGEVWADFVDSCIAHGWYGLENLAGIPGTVGAAPVQNVGAYGSEAKDVIYSIHCFEIGSGDELWIPAADCQFAYRWSRFKGEWANRYLIDRVRFRLSLSFTPNLSYKALAAAFPPPCSLPPAEQARLLADTVVSIRDSKLPNPKQIGSAGSFFKNPVVDSTVYQRLKTQFPDIVAFPLDDGNVKLAAGWLIEQCGWKGRKLGPVGVYDKQALVLVNLGNATGKDVETLANTIINDVKSKFSITISPEAIYV